jgi:carbon monoxide dehydrogenase subunit G
VKVEGRHTFSKSRPDVWGALQDPETLAATLPGVTRLEVTAPDRYTVAALVGVGSVRGVFEGTFSVEHKRELESCVLRGAARGASGSAQIEAKVRLADLDGGTALEYSADASVGGPIAGVGQRMIATASKKMATQFFNALDAYEPGAARAPEERAADVAAKAPRTVFERAPAAAADGAFLRGLVAGFALAIAGVAVGRWTARGR